MTFGSLFAGIGGMDLGLERAGMKCSWQVEIDPFCRKVLAKHWPDIPRHDDVRTFPDDSRDWTVDLIAGGFPCQPVSDAGIRGDRHEDPRWLWPQFARVIRTIRPRFTLLENVAGLLVRGVDEVLGDLAEMGLDAEWGMFSAAWSGADHIRERWFLLAYPCGLGFTALCLQPRYQQVDVEPKAERPQSKPQGFPGAYRRIGRSGRALPEPGVCGVADGFPTRLDRDRIRSLGNSVVPQVAEWIGKRILECGI